MNTNDLLQTMLEVVKSLENNNYIREADKVSNLMIRVAQGSKWYDPSGKFYEIGRRMKQQGQTVPGLIGNAVVGDLQQSYKGLMQNQMSNQSPNQSPVASPENDVNQKVQSLARKPVSNDQDMISRLMEIGQVSGNDNLVAAIDLYKQNGGGFDAPKLSRLRRRALNHQGALNTTWMQLYMQQPWGTYPAIDK
jgi:hypothetical protein